MRLKQAQKARNCRPFLAAVRIVFAPGSQPVDWVRPKGRVRQTATFVGPVCLLCLLPPSPPHWYPPFLITLYIKKFRSEAVSPSQVSKVPLMDGELHHPGPCLHDA